MSAVCPRCGVAVVPGYVKCPKCHTALPSRAQQSGAAGGTAVAGEGGGRMPILAIAAGLIVAIVIVVFFATRKSGTSEAAPLPDETQPAEQPAPAAAPPVDPTALPPDPQVTGPARPDPQPAMNALTTALQAKRLWGTVTTNGVRVDVRSGACGDPGMAPVIDAAVGPLHDAGLTKLRCLEQSGAVVFERDL